MEVQAAEIATGTFVHDAFFFDGVERFLEQVGGTVREGHLRDDVVVVATDLAKIAALRDHLGPDARPVEFIDMAVLGRNPARIIPILRDTYDSARAAGRGVTGVGEPVWSGQRQPALVESERHETLLNLAFADSVDFRLTCPYDLRALEAEVIEEALRNHPTVVDASGRRRCPDYLNPGRSAKQLQDSLPAPVPPVVELPFTADVISAVRAEVERSVRRFGLGEERVADISLAIHELVTNSVRHGGGAGLLRCWHEEDALVLEVSDTGTLVDPLAGRRRPDRTLEGGRGLWLVNQLCDVVQMRSSTAGTVVRVHTYREH